MPGVTLNSEKRIDYIKQKYWKKIVEVFPDNPRATWENLIRQSSSTRHKYLDWLVTQVLNHSTLLISSDDNAKCLLECFHDRKRLLSRRDINTYTFHQLHETLAQTQFSFSGKQKKKAEKQKLEEDGHIKTLYRADNLILWEVGSKEGAAYLGRGTKWCTNDKITSGYNSYSNAPLYVIKTPDDKKYQCCFAVREYRDCKDEPIEIEELLTKHPELITVLLAEPLNMLEPVLIAHNLHMVGATSVAIASEASPEFYNKLPQDKKTEALKSRIRSLKQRYSYWEEGDTTDTTESWPPEEMTDQEIVTELESLDSERRISVFEYYPEITKRIFHLLGPKARLEVATYAPDVTISLWCKVNRAERNAVIQYSPERLIDVIDKLNEAETRLALSLSGELIQYFPHKATKGQRLTALRQDGENIQFLLHDMTSHERLVAIRSTPDAIRYFYPLANMQEKAEALVRSPKLCALFSKTLPISLRQGLEYGHWEEAFSHFWEVDTCEEFKLQIRHLLRHPHSEKSVICRSKRIRRRSTDIHKTMLKITGVQYSERPGKFDFWQHNFPFQLSDEVIVEYLKEDLNLLHDSEWVERVMQNEKLPRDVSTIILQEGQSFISSPERSESLISAFEWILAEAKIKPPKWMRTD